MTNKHIGIFFGILLVAMFSMYLCRYNKNQNNMYIEEDDEENCKQCKG
jgi:hypothetical protein